MFSVVFEMHRWNAYLDNAKLLQRELEQLDGFVDNIGYRSLTREGWLLSPSGWRDEKPWCGGRREASQYYSPMDRHRVGM